MTGWQAVLAEYRFLQTCWDAACVIVPLAMILAFAGLFFISATAKILATARKRSSFDKCSRQLAILGLILGWTLLVGYRVWLYYTQAEHIPGSLQNFMLELGWMLMSMGVLLSSIYYTLWRILKNMPVLHATLGMISATQNCLAFICVLFCIRLCAAATATETSHMAVADLFPSAWEAPLWTALCVSVPLIFAMAGAFGSCWMSLRRNKDDFGRDYYNQMLPWTTAWARNCWLVLWALLLVSDCLRLWMQYEHGTIDMDASVWMLGRLLLWLIPVLLWTIVCRSKIVIRNRWCLYAGWVIALSFMLPYFLEITLI